MYEKDTKSETVLARAVHLLTLGAYAWGDDGVHSTSWRELGGGDVGSSSIIKSRLLQILATGSTWLC